MKRLISIIMVALSMTICMAGTTDKTFMNYLREIVIQGGYDSVATVRITPIPVQSENFLLGMPFPINDPTAQFGANTVGRKIASWYVLANKDFVLDINAEILHNYTEDGLTSYKNGLGYSLTFEYDLSYHSGNVAAEQKRRTFTIDVPRSGVNTSYDFKDIYILSGINFDKDSLVGSADGAVYFSFDSTTSELINDSAQYDQLPDGNYSATVTITMRVG